MAKSLAKEAVQQAEDKAQKAKEAVQQAEDKAQQAEDKAQKAESRLQRSIEKAISTGSLADEQIAAVFEVSVDVVASVRKELGKG